MIYRTQRGDYLAKIAAMNGVTPEAIWNDPMNMDFQKRDPNMLRHGDLLFVPDPKEEPLPLEREGSNDYVADAPEVQIVVTLSQDGKPIANEPYFTYGNGPLVKRQTDGKGVAKFPVNVFVSRVRLVVPSHQLAFILRVGYLQPATTHAGIRSRLVNLGFHSNAYLSARHAAAGTAQEDPRVQDALLAQAVAAFQRAHRLPVTGQVDAATRARIAAAHETLAPKAGG